MQKKHFRFKAKIVAVDGSKVTLETFTHKEAVPLRGQSKFSKKYETGYTIEPIEIPSELIGRQAWMIL